MNRTMKKYCLFTGLMLSISLCNAQISFIDTGQRLGSGSSNDVALGDLDGDGDLDAFVINGLWNVDESNEIWFNDGNGNFTASTQEFENSKSGEVGLADLDGDGHLDAFIGYFNYVSGQPNEVWFNDGTGYFTDSGQRLGNDNGGVTLADLDNDGDIDAFNWNHIFSDGTSGAHKVWLNDGSGIFTDSGQRLGHGNHTSAAPGDVDGDGDMDILVTFNYNDAGNKIWINDGTAYFTEGQLFSMTHSSEAKFGDLDDDGDLDIFFVHWGGNKIWFNNGSAYFTDSGQELGGSDSESVGLGDFDDDGDLDAFILNAVYQVPETNEIWINDGLGQFTDTGEKPGTDESYDVELGDLDGDGDLDAFIAVTGPNKVWLNISPEGISDDISSDMIRIFSNPITSIFTVVQEKTANNKVDIAIYTLQGGLILFNRFSNAPAVIDLAGLPAGIYLINVKVGTNVYNTKIFKK
ncbi:MAG: T9SS type A sorting domain-containing protein [Bacteroidales bacterium]|nr:T9SS type A sorting domain-containing protein [Bacteroidales bacterium]